MNILIMAGGSGTRLWPASRKQKPKQLLNLLGDKTLLQNTYKRSLQWVSPENIYIATTTEYADSVSQQLPEIKKDHYSLEPCLRGRGPAIGLATLIMHHHNPDSIFMTMWSDHSIKSDPKYFPELLNSLQQFLTNNPKQTITVGVKPKHAHTGLGYIEKGSQHQNGHGLQLYKLNSFKEKPDKTTAEKFISDGNYLWNSGYFVWKTENLLDLYKQHMPEVYKILMEIKPFIGTPQQQSKIDELYPTMPNIDIESGLLEKIQEHILTLEGQFEWDDIGSWKIIKHIQSTEQDNVTEGLSVNHNTEGSLIYNYADEIVVATVGLKNLIVVVTPEAVLVADKESSEDIKKIISQLEQNEDLKKYL